MTVGSIVSSHCHINPFVTVFSAAERIIRIIRLYEPRVYFKRRLRL